MDSHQIHPNQCQNVRNSDTIPAKQTARESELVCKSYENLKNEKFWSWVNFGFDFGAPPHFPDACLEFSPKLPGSTRVIFFLTRSCSRVFSPETRSATRSCCRSEFFFLKFEFFFLNWLDLGLAPIEEEEKLEEDERTANRQ